MGLGNGAQPAGQCGGARTAASCLAGVINFDISGNMEIETALACLAALSQPTRLEAFRLLVRHEPKGLPAGDIARALGAPQNTLSTHLNILSHAGLVTSVRKGRNVVYRADLARLNALARFLAEDCCGGAACAPADILPLANCEPEK